MDGKAIARYWRNLTADMDLLDYLLTPFIIVWFILGIAFMIKWPVTAIVVIPLYVYVARLAWHKATHG